MVPHTPSDSGLSLVGLLVVVVVLAGMGAAALAVSQNGSGGDRHGPPLAVGATTLSPSPVGAAVDINAAAATACRTNYQAAVAAAEVYRTLNGRPPANISDLSSVVKDPLSGKGFTVSINPGEPGQVEVATPGHPAAPGGANCAYAR